MAYLIIPTIGWRYLVAFSALPSLLTVIFIAVSSLPADFLGTSKKAYWLHALQVNTFVLFIVCMSIVVAETARVSAVLGGCGTREGGGGCVDGSCGYQ